jgi:hypothetical protein
MRREDIIAITLVEIFLGCEDGMWKEVTQTHD